MKWLKSLTTKINAKLFFLLFKTSPFLIWLLTPGMNSLLIEISGLTLKLLALNGNSLNLIQALPSSILKLFLKMTSLLWNSLVLMLNHQLTLAFSFLKSPMTNKIGSTPIELWSLWISNIMMEIVLSSSMLTLLTFIGNSTSYLRALIILLMTKLPSSNWLRRKLVTSFLKIIVLLTTRTVVSVHKKNIRLLNE